MNAKVKGYTLGAIAAATYGMNPLFTLPLYKEGMDPDSVLFFRYLFAIPILGIMLKARGRNFKLNRKEIVPLILFGWLVALSSLALFQSYSGGADYGCRIQGEAHTTDCVLHIPGIKRHWYAL